MGTTVLSIPPLTRRRWVAGCGLVQLELSRGARARRRLRGIIARSMLSIREVASALGVSDRTLERHLAGQAPSQERLRFYEQLEAIVVDGDHIVFAMRRVAPTRKRHGFRAPPVCGS